MKGKQTTANSSRSQTIPDASPSQSQSGSNSQLQHLSKQQLQHRQASSVPISVYRDLAQELKTAKQQLSTLNSENRILRQHNQSLRQEISQVITAAAALHKAVQAMDQPQKTSTSPPTRHIAQSVDKQPPHTTSSPSLTDKRSIQSSTQHYSTPSHSNSVGTSHGFTDDFITELDRTFATQQIGKPRVSPTGSTPTISAAPNSSESIASGPFCEVDPTPLNTTSQSIGQRETTQFFTDQPSSAPDAIALDSDDEKYKPISGIWLTLTLLVVIVTAFSAGFLAFLPFTQPNNDSSQSTQLNHYIQS